MKRRSFGQDEWEEGLSRIEEREKKNGQEGERERANSARGERGTETQGGVIRRKERENDGERPYFSGPCLEHIHVCIHASVRPHPRERKRISRGASVACVYKEGTHTHIHI